MLGVWLAKVIMIHLIIFIVCPIVFVLTVSFLGRWFNLEIAPDSLVASVLPKRRN